jgi:OOP family OmpA-OmpF porin
MSGQERDYATLWITIALTVAGAVIGIAATSSEPSWVTGVIALGSGIGTLILLVVYGRRVLAAIDRWDQRMNSKVQPTAKKGNKRPSKTRARVAASLLAGLAIGIGWIGGTYISPKVSKAQAAGVNASPAARKDCPNGRPLLFAVSGRMYSPSPVFTKAMQTAAVNAIQANSPIGFLNIDGRPHMLKWTSFGGHPDNPYFKSAALAKIETYISGIRATSPHADVLDSFAIAADAIHSICGNGTLFLEDSGLQDTKPLSFTDNAMFTANPTDVVNFLSNEKELPDMRGINVTLVGIGYTAPPETQLNIQQRAALIDIWSAIAKASGAATPVNVDRSPLTGAAPANVPAVELVKVPVARQYEFLPSLAPIVLQDNGPAGFLPDSAKFRDASAATAALKEVATYLQTHPSAKIEVTGTSADNEPPSTAIELSRQRANAVKSLLVKLGASASQITVIGVGSHFSGYVNDHGPGGVLLPGPAERNRTVIISSVS